jgi:hypothetical protein
MTSRQPQTTGAGGACYAPPCPYCRAPLVAGSPRCEQCGRDPSARRRPCPKCARVTPSVEPVCWNCGTAFKSDMRWKVPLIIALFLLSFVLTVLLALVRVLLG